MTGLATPVPPRGDPAGAEGLDLVGDDLAVLAHAGLASSAARPGRLPPVVCSPSRSSMTFTGRLACLASAIAARPEAAEVELAAEAAAHHLGDDVHLVVGQLGELDRLALDAEVGLGADVQGPASRPS